jgi:glucosamine--fructose-6-phosphate aminotransferase (isomerizing)
LGILEDGRIVASDPAPILRYTKDIIFLSDGEICIIKKNSHSIRTLDNEILEKAFEKISFDDTLSVKGGFKHFMLKEIFEMPEAVENSLRGRIIVEEGDAKLGGLSEISEKLSSIERIIIVGCGTSYYAGLCAENLIENLSGIPVEVEIASEFRYKPQVINSKTLVIAISQSGETADTLEAMREAKRQNVLTLGIVNVVGSTIAREAGVGIYNHAGPEIGVASTKAFVSQVSVLALVALFLARRRGFSSAEGSAFIKDLISIPAQMRKLLERSSEIETIASKYARFENFLFIGRRSSLPMAYEGALKLKEVSYVHAEGYGAGEMKHGPLAMIDENFPTIALVLDDSMRMKTISNIEEIKARRGKVFAVATKSDPLINKISDDVFFIPKTNELLEPLIFAIPLYLFAYYTACHKNLDPDRPRNLAKSVTVE